MWLVHYKPPDRKYDGNAAELYDSSILVYSSIVSLVVGKASACSYKLDSCSDITQCVTGALSSTFKLFLSFINEVKRARIFSLKTREREITGYSSSGSRSSV